MLSRFAYYPVHSKITLNCQFIVVIWTIYHSYLIEEFFYRDLKPQKACPTGSASG